MATLASRIVRGDKVVIVTGAGLSVASGIRAFRTTPSGHSSSSSFHTGNGGAAPAGLWNSVIWTTATRECFRKDPLTWYNEFFLPHFHTGPHLPNWGHRALQELMEEFDNVVQITQNIDALQPPTSRLIEIHGRVGLYKCLNDENEDSSSEDEEDSSDDDSDEDRSGKGMGSTPSAPSGDHRPRVRLGHRKQSRRAREGVESSLRCPYQFLQALDSVQIQPESTRCKLVSPFSDARRIEAVPRCPACHRLVMPMALMFDEGYHSHTFFQFEKAEDWLERADVLVFCGTSFSVRITAVALELARSANLEVYNFNKHDLLGASSRLNVSNVVGDLEETLPKLMRECREQLAARDESVRSPSEGTSLDLKSQSVPPEDLVCNMVVAEVVS